MEHLVSRVLLERLVCQVNRAHLVLPGDMDLMDYLDPKEMLVTALKLACKGMQAPEASCLKLLRHCQGLRAHPDLQESLVTGENLAQCQYLIQKQVFKLCRAQLALKVPLDLKAHLDYVASVEREESPEKLP